MIDEEHLGNTRMTITQTGDTNLITYKPYGDTLHTTAGEEPRMSYYGEQRDYENRYITMGARLYDPDLGQFLSVDPLSDIFAFSSPYVYANNSHMKPYNSVNVLLHTDLEVTEFDKRSADKSCKFLIVYNFNDPSGLAPEKDYEEKFLYLEPYDEYGIEGTYAVYDEDGYLLGCNHLGGISAQLDGIFSYVQAMNDYNAITSFGIGGNNAGDGNGETSSSRTGENGFVDWLKGLFGGDDEEDEPIGGDAEDEDMDDENAPDFGSLPEVVVTAESVNLNAYYYLGILSNSIGTYSSIREYSYRRDSFWKGNNGKWYSTSWGGNKWTGARSSVLKRANLFKLGSRVTFYLGTPLNAYQGYMGIKNGNYDVAKKSAADILAAGIGTYGGPYGLAFSGLYFGFDVLSPFLFDNSTIPYISPCFAVPDNTRTNVFYNMRKKR
jgi:RHS repeat-associated protein